MLPALIAAGSTILGGILQSNSANKAADRQAEASAQAIQAQQRAAEQARGVYAPTVNAYGQGLNALSSRLGVGGGMDTDDAISGVQGFDPGAYMQANPDVARRAQEGVALGLIGAGKQWTTPEEWAAFQYANTGKDEGRAAPTTPAPSPTDQQPNGNALTGAPTYGHTADPTYTAPAPFSFSIDEFKSNPAYQFALDQGSGQVMANSAATGALQSGAALKALQDRGQKTAYNFYAGERDSAYNRYNTDRLFDRSTYESDRSYLTGRSDRATDDLFRYTGLTQNALTGTANAYLGEGNATADGLRDIGSAGASNALTQGNIWSNMVGSLGGQAAGVLNKSSGLDGWMRGAGSQNPYLF